MEISDQATDKARFFNQLYALNDSSDGEPETNDIRDTFRQRRTPKITSLPSSSIQRTTGTVRTPNIMRTLPGIHRTASDPTSSMSVVKETPLLPRKSSLHRSDIESPVTSEYSVIGETPLAETKSRPRTDPERRTVSNPVIGSVVLANSTGITTMLGKRKRKDPSIRLAPADHQIFKGKTFYYIPDNDIAPLRRKRINKAREFGAIWSREHIPGITHVIVDKALTYMDVMAFLKLETLPSDIIMVNEDYPIDCVTFRALLDPDQRQYKVKGYQGNGERATASLSTSKRAAGILELKPAQPKHGKGASDLRKGTPPQREESTQISQSKENPGQLSIHSSSGAWIPTGEMNMESELVESPKELAGLRDGILENQVSSKQNDALDEMINIAKTLEHLPLDNEEDDRPPSRDDPKNSDDSDRSDDDSLMQRKTTYNDSVSQENFSCTRGGTGITPESNPNGRTIAILQEMSDYYTRMNDVWRPRAYRMAIGTLRKQSAKITSADEACKLPFVGQRLALKIEEIVLTDRLRRLESTKMEPNDHILQLFMNIYGVGASQGSRWVQQGHKTLDDLKAHVQLTHSQRIGIEHYNDFLTRIPREEVATLGGIVQSAAASLDSDVQVVIGGSFRRGAPNSGDIDCILTKPGTSSSQELFHFLKNLVALLTEKGFLVSSLSGCSSMWHGCCVLPGSSTTPIWRRIDLLLVPDSELGAALIYFTGDDIFNRSIRLLASKKGLRLNQRGLWKDVMRGPGRARMNQGSLIAGADEKKIFEILGVPWRPPQQRICN